MSIRDWLRPPRNLLVLFLGTTLVLTAGLGWLGWRLLQQDRAVEAQRVRDRLDSSADLITAEIRQTLSATEAQLTRFSTLSASSLQQTASEADGKAALLAFLESLSGQIREGLE